MVRINKAAVTNVIFDSLMMNHHFFFASKKAYKTNTWMLYSAQNECLRENESMTTAASPVVFCVAANVHRSLSIFCEILIVFANTSKKYYRVKIKTSDAWKTPHSLRKNKKNFSVKYYCMQLNKRRVSFLSFLKCYARSTTSLLRSDR